jgi:hypothetical protein
MSYLSLTLSIGAAVCGLCSGWLWYQASRISITPMWSKGGGLEPLDPSQSNAHWIVALLETVEQSSRMNRIAALWTAAAAVLGGAALIVSTVTDWLAKTGATAA